MPLELSRQLAGRSPSQSLATSIRERLFQRVEKVDRVALAAPKIMTRTIPTTPKSLRIGVVRDLGSWPRIPCPRRCPRTARHVATVVVGGEIPGRPIWETRFLVSLNKPRSHFILWMVWEPEFDEVCSPVCWMQRRNVNERDAACYLLRTWWTKERDESSEDRPWFNDVREGNVVELEDIETLINEVWPDSGFSDANDKMG